MKTVTMTIKGTKFYKANELFHKGLLASGEIVNLEHEPNNPHDENAVAVKLAKTTEMLGHISRQVSPKYVRLLRSNSISEAIIDSANKSEGSISIKILVTYSQIPKNQSDKNKASHIPAGQRGVYSIYNKCNNRQYIGSSENIRTRLRNHLSDLSYGCHANHVLQADFSIHSWDCFELKVLRVVSPSEDLLKLEERKINSLLRSRAKLYNLTIDGQGAYANYNQISQPVSYPGPKKHSPTKTYNSKPHQKYPDIEELSKQSSDSATISKKYTSTFHSAFLAIGRIILGIGGIILGVVIFTMALLVLFGILGSVILF